MDGWDPDNMDPRDVRATGGVHPDIYNEVRYDMERRGRLKNYIAELRDIVRSRSDILQQRPRLTIPMLITQAIESNTIEAFRRSLRDWIYHNTGRRRRDTGGRVGRLIVAISHAIWELPEVEDNLRPREDFTTTDSDFEFEELDEN